MSVVREKKTDETRLTRDEKDNRFFLRDGDGDEEMKSYKSVMEWSS